MRKIILICVLSCISFVMSAQTHQLSSHILDISTGNPASNVTIKLHKLDTNKNWELIDKNITDKNGRITNFLPYTSINNNGTYKLTFETLPYFTKNNVDSFYPFIEVVFTIKDNAHYHVPITISPFGYATYKGN